MEVHSDWTTVRVVLSIAISIQELPLWDAAYKAMV
jgi:hypothetical protein